MKIAISVGHGQHVRGAAGYLDEVNEAVRVVDRMHAHWNDTGVVSVKFFDTVSTTQQQNLTRIVDWHNKQSRDLDVSIHFNAYQTTDKPMGTECLYVSQATLASKVSAAVAKAGSLIDRGGKKRTDLYFLNGTNKPAILMEVAFVDSSTDAGLYNTHYEAICKALAETISGRTSKPRPPADLPFTQLDIKCSVFGGKADPNDSAYPPFDKITDVEASCALPFKFQGTRPFVLVRNRANNYEQVCEIRDLGPWLTDDPYWETNTRPLAETCWKEKKPLPRGPHKGKVPNGAGLDITPGAAKALKISGMAQVDWRFVSQDETETV